MRLRQSERDRWVVMLAEDNDDHALLVEMALSNATDLPVDLHRADSGTEALELIGRVEPDLILLDLHMPGGTGHDVLEALKADERFRRIPIAMLTSSTSDEDIARSYGLGGNHFITKPSDPAELESQLRTLLKNVSELRSIRRGAGEIQATAVSALDPATLAARRLLTAVIFVVAMIALGLLAYWTGALD